jgi:DUF971 family protein
VTLATTKTPWPVELRIHQAAGSVEIDFDDGVKYTLPSELLRVESPSAEVQGHGSGGKKIVAGKRRVRVKAAQPVGHYAVRLVFDDGHDTGLFTWAYLRKLGETQDHLWAEYLAQLQRLGLSRD